MKSLKNVLSLSALLVAGVLVAACGSSSSTTKQKGIVLQEGDRATLTVDEAYNGFYTITFPDELTAEDMALYEIDLVGYLLKSNAKINTSGSDYDGKAIYYYLHNAGQWLHQGIYESPAEMIVKDIKSIKISKNYMRLKDFNKLMPLLDNSKEKKNDQGYQDEIRFGNNYYYFIDVLMRH